MTDQRSVCAICGYIDRHHRECPSFVTSCRSADCPGEVRPTVEPAHFAGGMVIGDRLAYQCRTCGRMWDAGGQPMPAPEIVAVVIESDHSCIGVECPEHPNGPEVQLSPELTAFFNRTRCPECGLINQCHEDDCTRGQDHG